MIILYLRSFRLLSEFSHFLLEKTKILYKHINNIKFPSPFGVLSFLIQFQYSIYHPDLIALVSVSFRSSLISYSSAYFTFVASSISSGFRLLSEFSHFLFNKYFHMNDIHLVISFPSPFGVLSFLIQRRHQL